MVEITDIGNDGEGIGKCDGYTLFVKDAIVGDVVRAQITKPKKNYAYARVEEILTPSPFRIQPPCPIHRSCGGCQIQALAYEEQLHFKQNKVRSNLMRLGGFEEELLDEVMEPVVGMKEIFRYRNKAQYPIGTDKEGNPVAGFYAGRTHTIIQNTDCLLGAKENQDILEMILAYMKKYRVPAYNEELQKGLVRHVLIRTARATGQIMVCLVLNGRKLPHVEELVRELQKIPNMTSVSISVNTENTNVIMGTEILPVWGKETITDSIRIYKPGLTELDGREVSFQISPLSFYQVNPEQTEKLYSLALEYANLTGKETVWDLYCGIGTISLFLAGNAGMVRGVEIIPQAIEDAKENAKRNGITNAEFFVGKAEEVLPREYEKHGVHADVIVVDPPRKGCDEVCLETILKMQPERVVYVSCDSATLARDLRILCDGGYELKRVRPVDQFGHSVHVETIALLSRETSRPAKDYVKVGIDAAEYHAIKNASRD